MVTVVAQRDDPLIYHCSTELHSTIGMDEWDRREAEDEGLTPCSKCYPERAAKFMQL